MSNWKIDNLSKANWALGQLRKIEDKRDNIRELADEEIKKLKMEIARVEHWKKKETSKFDNSELFFRNHLEEYYRENLKVDPKFRINTPNGKISIKKQQPKFNRDNEKLVKWLKERNLKDYIKVEEKAQWGELKKATKVVNGVVVTEDGEIVEGVEVEYRDNLVNIKLED